MNEYSKTISPVIKIKGESCIMTPCIVYVIADISFTTNEKKEIFFTDFVLKISNICGNT